MPRGGIDARYAAYQRRVRADSRQYLTRNALVARNRLPPRRTPKTLAEMAGLTLFRNPRVQHNPLNDVKTYKNYIIDYSPMGRFALTLQRVWRGLLGRRRYRREREYNKSPTLIDLLLQRLRLVLGTEPLNDDEDDWWD